LERHQRKVGHWAWWVFPTEKEGFCEPPPKTAVTPSSALQLLQRAPPQWRQVLERLLALSETTEGGIRCVLPSIDHPRVRYFAAFWKRVPSSGEVDAEWIRHLAAQFEAALGAAAGGPEGGASQVMLDRARQLPGALAASSPCDRRSMEQHQNQGASEEEEEEETAWR
jgi:hypothetical protein